MIALLSPTNKDSFQYLSNLSVLYNYVCYILNPLPYTMYVY